MTEMIKGVPILWDALFGVIKGNQILLA